MMVPVEDHFSEKAGEYALYRPHYPRELFSYLASVALSHRLAWDCGTGNGQAAKELARHFDRIIATDISTEQLANAFPHERIEYRLEPAEKISLEDHSVDLVTVAQAVHWFDLERFYQTVRRVSAPGGVLAVWTYHLPEIEPSIDAVIIHYYREVLAGFWPEKIHHVDERYQSLPFPFEELSPPEIKWRAEWDLHQLAGFLQSWSGTQRYQVARGQSPIQLIWQALLDAWGDPDRSREISWALSIRLGRVR